MHSTRAMSLAQHHTNRQQARQTVLARHLHLVHLLIKPHACGHRWVCACHQALRRTCETGGLKSCTPAPPDVSSSFRLLAASGTLKRFACVQAQSGRGQAVCEQPACSGAEAHVQLAVNRA